MKESRIFCKSGIAGLFLAALAFVSGAAAEDATVYVDRYGNVVKQVFAVPQTFDAGAGKTTAGGQAGTPGTGTAGLQGEAGGTETGVRPVTVVVTDTRALRRLALCAAVLWRFSGVLAPVPLSSSAFLPVAA